MTRQALRIIGIAATLARYRLDELLVEVPMLRAVRAIRLLPWGRRKVRDLPRGVRLRLALEELGPIYVKFGQILSTRRDLFPGDIVDELAELQDAVPPFPGAAAQAVIEHELKTPVAELFAEFDLEPIASASIAQVHAARLHDGRAVVVKVVRPGIATQIRRDLSVLRSLARLLRRFHPEGERIRPDDLVAEFERVIFEELDMRREGANASALRRNWQHSADLYIPEIHFAYTAGRVLTMEQVGGIPIKQINELKRLGVDLGKLARRSIRVFYNQVFRDNLFHADMHPGNIRVDVSDPSDPSFIALDFGIVASLPPIDLYYMSENFLALFNKDYRKIAELHVEAGWLPDDTSIEQMEAAARTVSEPAFTRPLEEVSFARLVMDLFDVARRFKLTLQPQLIMLQKTLLNIEGMARELDPGLNIWEVAKPELERIVRERYGLESTARAIGHELPGWLARAPKIPDLVFDYLKLAGSGKLVTRIDSRDLARMAEERPRHNRRTPKMILAAGLLITSALLAAGQVGPLVESFSLSALAAALGGLLLAWRGWRG